MKIYIYILEQDLEQLYKQLTHIEPVGDTEISYKTYIGPKGNKDFDYKYDKWINLSLRIDDFIRLKDCNILKKL